MQSMAKPENKASEREGIKGKRMQAIAKKGAKKTRPREGNILGKKTAAKKL
ncbi:MAG: hypothetical protein Tsb0015_12500 [Simkaniaceae bacterium]